MTNLERAEAEAHRFLKTLSDYRIAKNVTEGKRSSDDWKDHPRYSTVAEQGAIKRASMDLTRALAEIRKRGGMTK